MFRKIKVRKPKQLTIKTIADLLSVLNRSKDLLSAFTSVMVGLDREYREDFGTMAVTLKNGRYRLIIGDTMDEMAADPANHTQLGVILCHELVHIVQMHIEQSLALYAEMDTDEDKQLWAKVNPLAVDYADNSVCIQTGLFTEAQFLHSAPLKEDGVGEYRGVLPSDMGLEFGLSYREYFDTLWSLYKNETPPSEWPGMPGGSRGDKGVEEAKEYMDKMSGGGNPFQHIEDILGEDLEGMDPDQIDDLVATAKAAAEEVKRKVVEGMKKRGHGGAGICELIEKSMEGPKMNWREILGEFVQEARELSEDPLSTNMKLSVAMLDLVKKSPYRLSAAPGTTKKPIFKVGVFIDTSGSVSKEMLSVFLTEIDGILEDGTELLMIHCDSKISHVEEVEVGGSISAEVHGRGGTCFNPPFEYILEEGIDLDLVLYFTDGEAPLPREENRVDIPVLWVVTEGCCIPGNYWSGPRAEVGELKELDYGAVLAISRD